MGKYTQKQDRVIREATRRLKKYRWFKGLYLDNLPTDEEIDLMGFKEAVECLIAESTYEENGIIKGEE